MSKEKMKMTRERFLEMSPEELLNLSEDEYGYEEYLASYGLPDSTKNIPVGPFDDGPHIPLELLVGCSEGVYDMKELDSYSSHLIECEKCQENRSFAFQKRERNSKDM